MFGLFKKRESAKRNYPLPSELDDDALVAFILKVFDSNTSVVAALFIPAWDNLVVFHSVFLKAANEDKTYQPSWDGMAQMLLESNAKAASSSIQDQVTSRRTFYLYVAILLRVAHERAQLKPELWDSVVHVWAKLLAGGEALHETLGRTSLWSEDELVFLEDVTDKETGERYVERLMPQAIRYHEAVKEWQERDLSPELKAELDRTMKLFRD